MACRAFPLLSPRISLLRPTPLPPLSSFSSPLRCSPAAKTRHRAPRPFLHPLPGPVRRLATVPELPVVVAEDDSFGGKQVISLTSPLYHYVLSNVREPPVLRELREETATMRGSQMQVSPDQAQLLAMLVQILGAQRCIEVGTYTGYSSLAVALVLPDTGRLVACERDGKHLEVAKKYYERAGGYKARPSSGLTKIPNQ